MWVRKPWHQGGGQLQLGRINPTHVHAWCAPWASQTLRMPLQGSSSLWSQQGDTCTAQHCTKWMFPNLLCVLGAAEPHQLGASTARGFTMRGPGAAPSSSGLPKDGLWRSTQLVGSHLPSLASRAGQECKTHPRSCDTSWVANWNAGLP